VNKYIKYSLLLIAVALVAYKSVYFEKLSARKNITTTTFDASAFSRKIWTEQFPAKMDSAIPLSFLVNEITRDSAAAINKYTHALAVGNYRYALIKLDSVVVANVKEDEIALMLGRKGSLFGVYLATEFIYGNAVRDASALVAVKDFPNTNELNGISEGLNKIIRTEVVPPFKSAVKKGDFVNVVAAVELNKDHIHWDQLELIPVRLQIVK
jgi:predicted lipoprotein